VTLNSKLGVRLEASAATELPMVEDTIASAVQEQTEGEERGYTQEFEDYNGNDARTMSPRRSIAELEKVGSEARAALEEQARALQSGLLALLERVDKVKEEHQKLEAENRFLQEYIGSLMATSKITGTGPSSKRNSRSGMGRVK